MIATDSLAEIARIAERHPGLRLTIGHLGGRGGITLLQDHAAMTHMPALLALATYSNVAVAATGVPGYSTETYPFSNMHTYLRQVYDAFGPHRMFWGTVISAMPCSWRQCVTMFHRGIAVAWRVRQAAGHARTHKTVEGRFRPFPLCGYAQQLAQVIRSSRQVGQ
jgi:hypothetical protein